MSRMHTIESVGHEPLRLAAFVSGPGRPQGTPATVLVEAYDDADDPNEPYAVLVLSPRQAGGLADGLRSLAGITHTGRPEPSAVLGDVVPCMRENGVPRFPDPEADGGIRIQGGSGLDPQSETFKAAERACAGHRPTPGASADAPRTDSRD